MRLGQVTAFVMFGLGLHRLWRLVPRAWRKRLVHSLVRPPQRAVRLARPAPRVVVLGMLRSSTSFGWLARFLVDTLVDAGVSVKVKDVSEGFAAVHLPPPAQPEAGAADLAGEATLLIVLTPDQFGYGLSFLPAQALERKYVIAYCPWELERLPREWISELALVDEVWTTATFVQDAFRRDVPQVRTRVIPCLLPLTYRPVPDRTRWGIADETYLVMLVFTLRSGLERKNPGAAIRAFQAAFPGDEDAVLVIKVSDTALEAESWAKLQALAGGDARIRFVTEQLGEEAMWDFLAMADTVISLHRAEGFGLVPAQAMMLGKAVVATGWSANLDFMDATSAVLVGYDLVPVDDPSGRFPAGLVWAEADVAEAAQALRTLFAEADARQALGARARAAIEAYIHTNQRAVRRDLAHDFAGEGATDDASRRAG